MDIRNRKLFTVGSTASWILGALVVLCGAASPALACLSPSADIEATVEELGPNGAGLEQLRVHLSGFELAELGESTVGCTMGLGLESQITGPPLWSIQRRAITTGLTIVDVITGVEHGGFESNSTINADFNFQPVGYGYFTWPSPVSFPPFTSTPTALASGTLPAGNVVLIFDLLVKPGYGIPDVVDDLSNSGHVSADYSLDAGGATYLLWSAFPLVHKINDVVY